jgi:hypothetical protein
MDHIIHEEKKTPNCTRKTEITSRSSAAVESGATKSEIDLSATTMAITERSSGRRRRRRRRRRRDEEEEEEVCSRGHN